MCSRTQTSLLKNSYFECTKWVYTEKRKCGPNFQKIWKSVLDKQQKSPEIDGQRGQQMEQKVSSTCLFCDVSRPCFCGELVTTIFNLSFLPAGRGRPHPQPGPVPREPGPSEERRSHPPSGEPAAQSPPGCPETHLIRPADVPGAP